MFTGIVEEVGSVDTANPTSLRFSASKVMDDLKVSDSININGTCLTVTSLGKSTFTVDASHETLAKTNLGKLKVGKIVNLERALKVGDKLGGHIVNGHVDGVGKVKSKTKQGESIEFRFLAPKGLSKYIVEKGSVAIDGVSLTVNLVKGSEFVANIIPYTQEATTFGGLRKGSSVNIECDIIGKYVEKFVTGTKRKNSGTSLCCLAQS